MNKRIAELHNQCIVRETRGTNAFDSYMVNRFDSDKFAELIVRDCMIICEDVMEKDNSALGCWSEIKRKFRS